MAKCAPINCHFVLAAGEGGGKECMSTNKLESVSGQLLFQFKSAASLHGFFTRKLTIEREGLV